MKLLRVKGRPTELFNTAWFDAIAMEQRKNDEAVERRTFSYIYNGDGRKISDKKDAIYEKVIAQYALIAPRQ